MPTASGNLALTDSLPRKKFTRQEVDRMLETGFFVGERWELIDGELIDKMGQNPQHAAAIRRLLKWLVSVFGEERVQVQLPIQAGGSDANYSVPEPDLAVLAQLKPEHDTRHPRGDELTLAVEVADSSAALDLNRKAALYAVSRVPEYWVLDLNRRMVIVHRQSDGAQYRLIQRFPADQTVAPENTAAAIRVSDLLPIAKQPPK